MISARRARCSSVRSVCVDDRIWRDHSVPLADTGACFAAISPSLAAASSASASAAADAVAAASVPPSPPPTAPPAGIAGNTPHAAHASSVGGEPAGAERRRAEKPIPNAIAAFAWSTNAAVPLAASGYARHPGHCTRGGSASSCSQRPLSSASEHRITCARTCSIGASPSALRAASTRCSSSPRASRNLPSCASAYAWNCTE
mmetsp:Transcript_15359/g.49030  ORF Transcript_15359/g.49030 Transcript_15359/m.49030 type:complete len:202 (-) Transcript_15359:972-1577(-)